MRSVPSARSSEKQPSVRSVRSARSPEKQFLRALRVSPPFSVHSVRSTHIPEIPPPLRPCNAGQFCVIRAGTGLEPVVSVAMGWKGAEQRRAPRIEVLRRVSGTLVPIDSAVVVHDLSRSGFGAVSHIDFRPGDVLDFRLASAHDSVTVTARVVHSRPFPNSSELFFTGFEFVRGELLGLTQESRIDRLIEAVSVREGMLVAHG